MSLKMLKGRKMRILIAGIDGYLGWPLALHLAARGHEVGGIDGFHRRRWVAEIGSDSAIPISPMPERSSAFQELFGEKLLFLEGDLRDYKTLERAIRMMNPDAIVHLGEMPSAPYSMIDIDHCTFTQTNNILSTLNILFAMRDICPNAHLIKLGTMGEYGTPNIDIPEGFFTIEYNGRQETLPFPRQAGSWYHQTKVHDSHNIAFACKIWGIRSTDIMQGVVFGTRVPEMGDDERLRTRFDFDQCFGTAINRFCAQAVIGHPLTPYGKGHQKRGFLPLCDSMQCLTLAIENPPDPGQYRVFNQFQQVYNLSELANIVVAAAKEIGIDCKVHRLDNPRIEAEEHYYNPQHQHLLDLGYVPTEDIKTEIRRMLQDLSRVRDRIEHRRDLLIPDIRWDGTRHRSTYVDGAE